MNWTKFTHKQPPRGLPVRALSSIVAQGNACGKGPDIVADTSQDNTLVAGAAGNTLAIKELEERDGVFTSDASQVLERRDRDAIGFLFLIRCEAGFQMSEGVAMKDEFGRDAKEDFFAQEEMKNLVGALEIDFYICENFL